MKRIKRNKKKQYKKKPEACLFAFDTSTVFPKLRLLRILNSKMAISKKLLLSVLQVEDSLIRSEQSLAINEYSGEFSFLSRKTIVEAVATTRELLSVLRKLINSRVDILAERRFDITSTFFAPETTEPELSLGIKNLPRNSESHNKQLVLHERLFNTLDNHLIVQVKVMLNNVFCHLTDNRGNTVFPVKTGASYGIKFSRVNIRVYLESFLAAYALDLKKAIKGGKFSVSKHVLFTVTSPKKFRRRIMYSLRNLVYRRIFLPELTATKILLKEIASMQNPTSGNLSSFILSGKIRPTTMLNMVDARPFNGCRQVAIMKKKRLKLYSYKARP